jgi:threonyl-tRNA synthetase
MSDSITDHVAIGNEKTLFIQHDSCPGSILWQPNGTRMFNTLVDYFKITLRNQGYKSVKTPILYKSDLWMQTNNWNKYYQKIYVIGSDKEVQYGLKPINCLGHALIYKSMVTSERELPLRLMEFGDVHRNEPDNSLDGLYRLRQFTQDDANVFCTIEQVEEEINKIIDFAKHFYSLFGFKYIAELSTRPSDSIGTDDDWKRAEEILGRCVVNLDNNFKLNEGNGEFYGPKIDIKIIDSKDREWECGSIQLDFNISQSLDLKYAKFTEDKIDEFGHPVVIYSMIMGSVERFIAILLEHTEGKLPFWLDSNQIYIVPTNPDISENKRLFEYIHYLTNLFSDFNVKLDLSNNTLSKKIRNAQILKYHYIFIVNEKGVDNQTISYRHQGKLENCCTVEDVYKKIQSEFDFMKH